MLANLCILNKKPNLDVCSLNVSFQLHCMKLDQLGSVAQSWPTLCDPWTAAHQVSLPITNSQKLAQTHVHRVSDVIQPSHPVSLPSPSAFNQGLFQWASSLHQVAKVLEFQLQHQLFQ